MVCRLYTGTSPLCLSFAELDPPSTAVVAFIDEHRQRAGAELIGHVLSEYRSDRPEYPQGRPQTRCHRSDRGKRNRGPLRTGTDQRIWLTARSRRRPQTGSGSRHHLYQGTTGPVCLAFVMDVLSHRVFGLASLRIAVVQTPTSAASGETQAASV
jgi:hypothetical protein